MSAVAATAEAGETRRRSGLDGPLVLLTALIVLLGLIMVTSASMGSAAEGGDPFAFLERQLLLVLIGIGCAGVTFSIPTATLDKLSLPLLLLGAADAGDGADSGARARGQRQSSLAAPGGRELSGVGSGAGADADLHRQLRGAARGGDAQQPGRRVPSDCAAGAGGAAAARRAGLRCGERTDADRIRRAVHCGGTAALCVADAAARGRRDGAAGAVLELSHAPHDGLSRSLVRPIQPRLSAHAIADRDRTRRSGSVSVSARACRSCSTCPRRIPIFCSRCSPRSSAWSGSPSR